MLGDVILAEPGALIGFAGPRVIQQTIGQKLPEGIQRAEFLLEHGFVDRIVNREEMKTVLGKILEMHRGQGEKSRMFLDRFGGFCEEYGEHGDLAEWRDMSDDEMEKIKYENDKCRVNKKKVS